MACGFWDPNPADLKRIRQEIDIDGEEYRSILNNKTFKSVWGELQGEAVKTAPKGYAKDHPHIDLLRFKQHIFTINYTDKDICQPDFIDRADIALQAVRPFCGLYERGADHQCRWGEFGVGITYLFDIRSV